MTTQRDYKPILSHATPIADRGAAMAWVVAELWRAFGEEDPAKPTGGLVSWVGFYEIAPSMDEMVLVCREPKPACSPIGLHGMCGRGWKERTSFVVRDVAVLGEGYVACDTRDRSELVVPMTRADGTCWGVLDVDSYQVGAFAEHDAMMMEDVCRRVGLTAGASRVVTL
jgi:putative methionine-R-sulfoxide reductase with GAF domain